MNIGNTAGKEAPVDYGVTSKSGSINYQKNKSERKWVAEQSGIIGHDSLRLRANDTTLVGGLIANATRDENGTLIDQGRLDMETETLSVRHLYDIDRSKTVGGRLRTSGGGIQYIVPDRTQFSTPIFIKVIGDDL